MRVAPLVSTLMATVEAHTAPAPTMISVVHTLARKGAQKIAATRAANAINRGRNILIIFVAHREVLPRIFLFHVLNHRDHRHRYNGGCFGA